MNERETLKIVNGHLNIGGADAGELARSFGTPLYVFDEAYLRAMMRAYKEAIDTEYGGRGLVLYASKAFSCEAIYAIAKQEGIGADVVSGGELFTAIRAGFPTGKIYMHGNNKLSGELAFAVDAGVGTVVLDGEDEAEILSEEAQRRGVVQDVLIRINPGVEAHTHTYIQTAKTDSKFGFSVANGAADKMTKKVLSLAGLRLKGYHCHIGSQIFEMQSFSVAAEKCLDFIKAEKDKYGFEAEELNLGGGFGVWYNDEDVKLKPSDYRDRLKTVIGAVKKKCSELSLKEPFLVFEPGRSLVAEAGITLYTVGAIKEIPGIKKYVAIDGGMFDNPRYALYGAKYTAILAERADETPCELVSIAGKCCESGDLIGVDFKLPKAKRGDILAILSTGAYNYSMASNYNRNFIPPAVLVSGGRAEYIVKPQTYEDLVRNDVIPMRLKG